MTKESQSKNTKTTNDNKQSNRPKLVFTDKDKFDVSRLSLEASTEKYSSKAQANYMVRYDYGNGKKSSDLKLTSDSLDNLILATGPLKLTRGGVPRLGEYIKDDSQRGYFWLAKDETQPESVKLFEILEAIDERMKKELEELQNKNGLLKDVEKDGDDPKNFSSKKFKLKYTPIVRLVDPNANEDDDEDSDGETKKKSTKNDDKKKFVPYYRAKVFFSAEYDSADPTNKESRKINTKLFLGNKKEAENLSTPTDFEKAMPYLSTSHYIIRFAKLWRQRKPAKSDGKELECGFGLKSLQIVVTETPNKGSSQSYSDMFSANVFADEVAPVKVLETEDKSTEKHVEESNSDSESDKDEKSNHSKKSNKKSEKEESDKESVSGDDKEESEKEDSDAESDAGSGSESEVEEKPVKKESKNDSKSKKKVEESDEENSESEVEEKPTKKNNKKEEKKATPKPTKKGK